MHRALIFFIFFVYVELALQISILMVTLSLNVQVCKQYPGFLRVALQDPQPERRFFRRGWVTYDSEANVKETCYNLNQIRVCIAAFYSCIHVHSCMHLLVHTAVCAELAD